jgi:hypothetical protein
MRPVNTIPATKPNTRKIVARVRRLNIDGRSVEDGLAVAAAASRPSGYWT